MGVGGDKKNNSRVKDRLGGKYAMTGCIVVPVRYMRLPVSGCKLGPSNMTIDIFDRLIACTHHRPLIG